MQQNKKVAILFADIMGYSKLDNFEKKSLYIEIQNIENKVLKLQNLLFFKIWGDNFIIIMDSVVELAEFALRLRDNFINRNWEKRGIRYKPKIRIALNYGEVIVFYDDEKVIDVIGTSVDLTARIEPIVTPNQAFCSEDFSKNIFKNKNNKIVAKSLGKRTLPKDYGNILLFELEWDKHINEKNLKNKFIDKLFISNYKILDNFSINFQDKNGNTLKTVVLAGINGSGKTSILEYISFNFENSIYFPITNDSLDERENLINNPKKLVIDKIKAFIDKIKDENLDLTVREANQKAIDSINNTFKDIELSVEFNGISTDMERRLLFKNKKSDNIWLEELSTGEQQLFIRALSLKLLEPKEQVILIDEPETSLHPSWQQSILKVYENIAKEGNNQLIIATHSPHIISSAKKESVNILVNIDGDIKVLEDISGSYGFEVSRVLTELMGLKSLRVPEISKKIENLWNLIYEEKQEEYQKLYEELGAILGKGDEDIILAKLEIARNKSKKC